MNDWIMKAWRNLIALFILFVVVLSIVRGLIQKVQSLPVGDFAVLLAIIGIVIGIMTIYMYASSKHAQKLILLCGLAITLFFLLAAIYYRFATPDNEVYITALATTKAQGNHTLCFLCFKN